MKNVIAILFLVLCFESLKAQDTIYKQDGTRSVVTILLNSPDQVKYQRYSNPDSLIYYMDKNYIRKIVFQNGEVVVCKGSFIKPDSIQEQPNVDFGNKVFGCNYLSVNMIDFFSGLININYEYTFKSGKVAIKIPLLTGYGNFTSGQDDITNGYRLSQTIIGSGVNLNFYPFGQRQISYYVGPSLEIRTYRDNESTYNPTNQTSTLIRKTGMQYAISLQNGVLFQAGTHFYLSLSLGLGYKHNNTSEYQNDFSGRVGANIGYRF